MEVLLEWEGRHVIVVPFLGPGISLEPLVGPLKLEFPRKGLVRVRFPQMGIALPKATFIDACWVPGREEEALTVVQGGARVDVHLDGDAETL
jgi:hypothetical protein